MTKLLLISVLVFVTIKTTECVSCYTCNNVIDDSVCTNNITTCGLEQSCFKSRMSVNGSDMITLGCLDNAQCSGMTGVSSIVGRDVSRRQAHNCIECCSGDMCNTQLGTHQKPTACVDDETVDCAKMNSVFTICNDVQHAKSFCPKFCGLCNVVDGEWSKWSVWSHCDVSCNNGTESRARSCTNPRPEHGGLDCVGDKQEVRSCYTATVCPVNGGWSAWDNWESCSASCDTGIQRRTRNCTNPKPAYLGNYCFGSQMDARLCSNGPCVDGGWSSWSSWSKCSTSCGMGIRTQSRSCNNPTPSPKGQYYSDCSEIKLHEPIAQDGVYDVILWKTNRTIQVYCDMTTDGGGWTVFQNRFNGSVDFNRSYSQYVHGFGDLHSEFWLGLEYIQEMASQTVNELRIGVMSTNGTTAYQVFSSFSLSPPGYVLHFGNTISSQNMGRGFEVSSHNGQAFSTYDHDVDSSSLNCADYFQGAWWYSDCYTVSLNGNYDQLYYNKAITGPSQKRSRMAFRRKRTQ